jgi:lipopolysaccharide transport system permease protein
VTSPANSIDSVVNNLMKNWSLFGHLVKRDVLLRYRGAMLGALWMFLSPLMILGIFAFVLGSIFQSRWPQQEGGIPLWLTLYAGLIVFNIFAETVSRSPSAVRAYPNYVKKMIFPVQILPVVPLGTALFQALFNYLVMMIALAWIGHLNFQILLVPLLVIPVLLLASGMAWFIAAWGVFIKDMAQIVPVIVQMLLFLSPVLYPIEAVPELLRPFYKYNPLGATIDVARSASLGLGVDWGMWSIALVPAGIIAILGYVFFRYTREEFADVL